ncbi:MAG: acetyl-CoA C-acyltransferase, partial [Magnetococcales bacterium]|nr:acetyl-CoA C-acyltransferase [Magnetococcales bacterium]
MRESRHEERRPVYLVDGVRTPQLKARIGAGPFSASDLAVQAGTALVARTGVQPERLDEVILGCVMPAPDEVNIARIVALRIGCGHKVPAWTVQRNCASGMQALDSGVRAIESGYADLILAGGTEAMSRSPLHLRQELTDLLAAWGRARTFGQRLALLRKLRPKHLSPVVVLMKGLTDPVVGLSMGQTAERLAHRFGIAREEMDAFAMASHHRLAAAVDDGLFEQEITPLYHPDGTVITVDDGVRRDSSMEALTRLKPVFDRPFGTITAGNSAQVSDGAAILLLASEEAVERHGLTVRARLHAAEWAGLAPEDMGLGPAYAIPALLDRHDMGVDDV